MTVLQVRYGGSAERRRCEYQAPCLRIFPSRTKAVRFMKGNGLEMRETKVNTRLIESRLSGAKTTTWGDWIATEEATDLLPAWYFAIGHRRGERRLRFRDPEGRVFRGRGPLIRHLHRHRLRKKEHLEELKRLLKVNQTKHHEELKVNDKFIKHIEVDENYLTFIKCRYMNHRDVAEESDDSLPKLWRKKNINGVSYFRDPSGQHVFNSRRLVVEFLRKTRHDLSDEVLVSILEESEDESDLSDSEVESEAEDGRDSGLLEEDGEAGDQEMEEAAEMEDAQENIEVSTFVEC
jgi:hypothetical protein